MPLSLFEREALIADVLNELFGLGPLEALLKDPAISDILVNRFDQVYVERDGKLEQTDVVFRDDAHLLQIIERIVSSVGRRIDESSPMVDARLPTAPASTPSSRRWPSTARRCRSAASAPTASARRTWSTRESWTPPMMDFLQAAVACRLNMLVSGGTGSGKTTLLNVLSSFILDASASSRSRTPPSCSCSSAHVVRLETRPANIEGKGAVRAARAGDQRPAYAPRPHHRRRGPRRGSAGHAAGDEHRPRRQPDDRPRQQPARRALSPRHDGGDGQPEHPRARHPPADCVGRQPDRAGVAPWPTARAR